VVQSWLSVNTVIWWTLEPMNVDEEASWILIQPRFLALLFYFCAVSGQQCWHV